MRNLTGQDVDYQSLQRPLDERSETLSSSEQDPFEDANMMLEDSEQSSSIPSRNASLAGYNGSTVPPSIVSGSDLDRYPVRRGLNPSNATPQGNRFTRYSHSGNSDQSDRSNSLSSSVAYDTNPLLVGLDASPFGGYPASDFPLHLDEKEADDYLHNPDPIADAAEDHRCHKLDKRGWGCLLAFIALIAGFIAVFIVLPILDFTGPSTKVPAPNDGVRLSPYNYNILGALRYANGLVDKDTPKEAMTHTSYNGDEWPLVFSDEFSQNGRTFYPGDDPVWEAVDLHYQATEDLEWFSPDAAYTEDGVLKIRLDAFENHDLFYRSAMLQSWNKFCFSQGYIEVGTRLPGSGKYPGLWPGFWTLGNLARPGYLATSEGVWPYSYNECDAGITPNQSSSDGVSYLPGQRLNKCTCSGSHNEHPNPGIGRGAPEIDIYEGTVDTPPGRKANGVASQSLQVAPMDIYYMVDYDFIEIRNHSVTKMNEWNGGPLQQAISGTTYLNADWYEQSEKRSFQKYGVEYMNSRENGYISWYIGGELTYSMHAGALSPNGNIGWRDISKEPMSIVMNLGISTSWTYIDWVDLRFPVLYEIDYVRVYQPKGNVSTNCDPDDFPTSDYISNHPRAYLNANMTSWEEAGYTWPQNSLVNKCST